MKTKILRKNPIAIQVASRSRKIPTSAFIKKCVLLALSLSKKNGEITIRIVDKKESAFLNETYRHKSYATNVLAFPFKNQSSILGDLVICAPIVNNEAQKQKKSHSAHWAHIIIHGILHLLDYDHIRDKDAKIMEKIEIKLLEKLGYPNPYE